MNKSSASRGIFEVSEAHHDFLLMFAVEFFSSFNMGVTGDAIDAFEQGNLVVSDARMYRQFMLFGLKRSTFLLQFVALILLREQNPNSAFWAEGMLEHIRDSLGAKEVAGLEKIVRLHAPVTGA